MEKQIRASTMAPHSLETSPHGSSSSWILVQEGLFEYPLADDGKPTLLANRCMNCGTTFFPKRALCPACFEQGFMEDIELDRRGILYACTVIHRDSPTGVPAPYAYGYVEIPTNQVRVFALLTGSDPSSFHPGQEVELVVEPIRTDSEGKQIIGYKFKPVS
jgi:uncharacterized OB-fold protein